MPKTIEDQRSELWTHQHHPGIAIAVGMQLRQLHDFLRGERIGSAGTLRSQLQEMRSTAAWGVHGVGDMVRDRCQLYRNMLLRSAEILLNLRFSVGSIKNS